MSPENISQLGVMLRSRRREKRMTLRDIAAETGVSLNTLSRIENGHIPDLKNFQRVVDWLGVPAETFLEPDSNPASTPDIIARHLQSDSRLSAEAVSQITGIVEEMYRKLTGAQPRVAVHLRSAKTFTPTAAALLSDMLSEMQSSLISTSE